MLNIKELIKEPSALNAETLPELKAIVEKYPFFQTARLLYLSNLYQLRSKHFGQELRKASIFVPDRTALFVLTESVNYQLTIENQTYDIETENDGNKTLKAINRYLSRNNTSQEKDGGDGQHPPTPADLITDYAVYLLQQDTDTPQEAPSSPSPRLKGADLIDHFIEETQGKQRMEMPQGDDEDFISPEFSDEEEEIYTESMVNIYIKQGRYQQALEILRKICLNNPKKSSNFAVEMNLLGIIIGQTTNQPDK